MLFEQLLPRRFFIPVHLHAELHRGGDAVYAFISTLAEHFANLSSNRHASLLIAEAGDGSTDSLAKARTTLIGTMEEVEISELLKESFLKRHPIASYVHFEDFKCFKFTVLKVRQINGFGSMGWLSTPQWQAAQVDPIGASGDKVDFAISHMNTDHADSLVKIVQACAALKEEALEKVQIVSIDRFGFDVRCTTADEQIFSRVGFLSPLDKVIQLRSAFKELAL